MGAAVRIVLEAFDFGRDAVLVALEIDDAVVVLVTTALMAHGNVAVAVTPGLFRLAFGKLRCRFAFVQSGRNDLDQRPPTGRRRLDFD
jgi:hypothetical protein